MAEPLLQPGNVGDLVVRYDGLARLLPGRSAVTLKSDLCRRPETLPPPVWIPGAKGPVWVVADVIAWLRNHTAKGGKYARAMPRQLGRGAPTKGERLEAEQLGITVRELRARRSGAGAK